ncbi:MAG: hypothetical protein JWN72_2463 [Thermoleophilia bacterium]|nr:hypothetical protein [Thermoleophilia bacterium]
MGTHLDDKLRAKRFARLRSQGGSATGGDHTVQDDASAGEDAGLFDGVSAAVRLQMELVARASASPATALPAVIALIVDGSPQKRAAIIAAIEETEPLREQWERTWAVLRR